MIWTWPNWVSSLSPYTVPQDLQECSKTLAPKQIIHLKNFNWPAKEAGWKIGRKLKESVETGHRIGVRTLVCVFVVCLVVCLCLSIVFVCLFLNHISSANRLFVALRSKNCS